MRTKELFLFFLGLMLLLSITSCSKIRNLKKSGDWRLKYSTGVTYYENKNYYHAALLFENIRPVVRGMPEGEQVEFMLAYCQYHEKNYLLAANQFRLFYETYGRSSLAEEAHFMYAYSLYAFSPIYTLDQQTSIDAMLEMQAFINQYPSSEFNGQASEIITECQQKLEKKNYNSAELYLKLKRYKAAISAFESFEENFPGSQYLEDIAFLKVEAQFKLAEKSLASLKEDRFRSTIRFYEELVDKYPQSSYLKEAERYYVKSRSQIERKTNKL